MKYAILNYLPSNWISDSWEIKSQFVELQSQLSKYEHTSVQLTDLLNKDVIMHKEVCLGTA